MLNSPPPPPPPPLDNIAAIMADDIFKYIFLNENDKIPMMKLNFNETCSKESNWQSASIGPGSGLVPNRRQAIIWINDDLVYWRIYAAPGGYELNIYFY